MTRRTAAAALRMAAICSALYGFGVVGAVENGADLARMWEIIPAICAAVLLGWIAERVEQTGKTRTQGESRKENKK